MSEKLETIPERVTKSTDGAKQVNRIVKQMYARAEEAKANGAPIVWSMVGIPKVLFVPLDIQPIFPEQVSSAFAAKQQALSFIEKSDTAGYPVELCGYARCHLGYAIRQEEVGGVPPEAPYAIDKPSCMLACTTVCDTRSKWFQSVSQHMDTPLFVLDQQYPPFNADPRDPETVKQYVQFYLGQLQELVAFLEKITGKKMDYDRLTETIAAQEKVTKLYYEITMMRRATPCPIASEDTFAAMVPFMYAVDQAETIEYYTALRDEVKERVQQGIGVIPDEKYRLYWNGIPMWNTMGIFNYFESQGAVFVIDDYVPLEPIEVDIEGVHPLEALARLEYWRMSGIGSSGGEIRHRRLERGDIPDCHYAWAERIIEWARDYKLDGQVRHLTLGCRAGGSGAPTHAKNMMEKHLGLPSLFLESDQIDIRSYSESQIRAKVDAFLETLVVKREQRLRAI